MAGIEEPDACFICLSSESSTELGPLGRHCQCPSLFSHRSCLTRWQLQNAGKQEERQCRFCHTTLGDWRTALTEVPSQYRRNAPIMAVVFQGKTVKVPVVTGPEGVAEFKRTVCKLFNLPEGTDFEVTFECKSPVFGDKLHLKGFDCFEAASYCAAVSAAKRATTKAARAAATAEGSGAASPRTHRCRSNTTGPSSPHAGLPLAVNDRSGSDVPSGSPTGSSHLATTSTATASASSQDSGEAAATTSSIKSSCSPSFVRRLLCRSRKQEPQQQQPPSPTTTEDGVSTPFGVQAGLNGLGSSATASMAENDSDRGLPTMQSDAPQAHVATTMLSTATTPTQGGTKSGRPLAASLASLFKRVM